MRDLSRTIVRGLRLVIKEGFVLLFSYPCLPTGKAEPEYERRLSPGDEELLALLAAGLKDRAIARQLGVGLSTVQRRVRRLMSELGAESRFQAGLRAAEVLGTR